MELLPGFGPGTSSLPRGEGQAVDNGISSFLPPLGLEKGLELFKAFFFCARSTPALCEDPPDGGGSVLQIVAHELRVDLQGDAGIRMPH